MTAAAPAPKSRSAPPRRRRWLPPVMASQVSVDDTTGPWYVHTATVPAGRFCCVAPATAVGAGLAAGGSATSAATGAAIAGAFMITGAGVVVAGRLVGVAAAALPS